MPLPVKTPHPKGETLSDAQQPDLLAENTKLAVETFGGRVHVEWDPSSGRNPVGTASLFHRVFEVRQFV